MAKPILHKCGGCLQTKMFRADQTFCSKECSRNSNRGKTDLKIAFLDIETAPSLGWVWRKWEQNVIDFEQNGYVMSYSFKLAGFKGAKTRGLPDFPDVWKKDRRDDSALLKELWQDLNSVDMIVAHNGDKFDVPQVFTRLLTLGIKPPKPFQTFDTLKMARNRFDFKSNKLDDLCRDLGIGRKLPHTGSHLWLSCMAGDTKSWSLMKRYNKHDVLLLEELYYRFLPWVKVHPNVNHSAEMRALYSVRQREY